MQLGSNFLEFWQFFSKFLAFQWATFQHFTRTIGKGLIRKGSKRNELTSLGCYRGLKRWVRCGMSPHVRMNPRRTKTVLAMDSGFHALKLWVTGSSRYWDSGCLSWIPRFQSPAFRIPRAKVSGFRNPRRVTLYGARHDTNLGSSYVSGKLPTYPSPKPTLTFTCHLGQNVGLRGWGRRARKRITIPSLFSNNFILFDLLS